MVESVQKCVTKGIALTIERFCDRNELVLIFNRYTWESSSESED